MNNKSCLFVVVTLFSSINIFGVMNPFNKAIAALVRENFSSIAKSAVNSAIKGRGKKDLWFRQNPEDGLKESGAYRVKNFDIPKEYQDDLEEKLKSVSSTPPLFYKYRNESLEPNMQVFKKSDLIGFSMNTAAEKVFLDNNKSLPLDYSGSFLNVVFEVPRKVTLKDYTIPQMDVIIDHELCHLRTEDSALKGLFALLNAKRFFFSNEEFMKVIKIVLGEDFIESEEQLIAGMVKTVNELGIDDFTRIKGFNLYALLFNRFQEIRVDKTILGWKDKDKIEAYRGFYQNDHDFVQSKIQKRIVACLKTEEPITVAMLGLTHPTSQERVNACKEALAKLANKNAQN